MATIKVNYNNSEKRTSTTFPEITARFFVKSWTNESDWTEIDKDNMFYRDVKTLSTQFQKSINEMTQKAKKTDWSKDELEYYIMKIISKEA